MNRELIKAIREFLQRSSVLEAQGVPLTQEQIEEFFRVRTKGRFGYADAQAVLSGVDSGVTPGNLGRSALQGALFNFGDEALELVDPAGAEEMRLKEELFRKEHPVADAVAGFAGGMTLPALGAGGLAARGAMGVGRAVATGAGVGAVSGAAAGFGAGEGLEDRLNKAQVGGGVGLVAGAAIPGVVGAGRLAFSPASRASRRLTGAIEASGGTPALMRRLQEFTKAGRGDEVALGDLSDRLRLETDFAVNNSDEALVHTAKMVRDRQADASQRVLGDVRDLAGSADAEQIATNLEEGTRRWARGTEGYGGLRAANPEVPAAPLLNDLLPYLLQPRVKETLRRVQLDGLIGDTPDMGTMSFQTLQTLKERVGDMASAKFAAREGQLASDLREVEDRITSFMQTHVPNYSSVAKEYARRKGLERAVQMGAEWFDADDTRGLKRVLDRLTEEEKTLFQRGMVSKLIARLRSAQTNRDEAKKLMEASPLLEDKLKIVFKNEKRFLEFMERMEKEATLAQMRGPLNNSATARRLQAQGFDPLELGVDAVATPAATLARVAARLGKGSIARRTAAEMAGPLGTQGADNIARVLTKAGLTRKPVGRVAGAALPAALGSLWQ